MITCSRCQQPVDETVRAACPLCFTPLPVDVMGSQPGAFSSTPDNPSISEYENRAHDSLSSGIATHPLASMAASEANSDDSFSLTEVQPPAQATPSDSISSLGSFPMASYRPDSSSSQEAGFPTADKPVIETPWNMSSLNLQLDGLPGVVNSPSTASPSNQNQAPQTQPLSYQSPARNAALEQSQPVYGQAPNSNQIYPQPSNNDVSAQNQPPQTKPLYSQSPIMSQGGRVSLTGEFIDAQAPGGTPPINTGGSPIPYSARVPGKPAGKTFSQASQKESKGSGGGSPVGIILTVLLMLGGGVGGWFWWTHRTNPKDQSLLAYRAVLSQDWKTAYPLLTFSEDDKKKYSDVSKFEQSMQSEVVRIRKNPIYAVLLESAKTNADSASVGDPIQKGEKVDVPTAMEISTGLGNIKFNGTAHMVNDFGTWKLEWGGRSNGQLGAAGDLIGKPNNLPEGLKGLPGS